MIARRLSDFVDSVRCPHCGRRCCRIAAEEFRGVAQCWSTQCNRYWWSMLLRAGDVDVQLYPVFGPELTETLMRTFAPPPRLVTAKFWQVRLTRKQFDAYGTMGSAQLLQELAGLAVRRPFIIPSGRV